MSPLTRAKDELRRQIEGLKEALADGRISMENYQKTLGRIQGLREALQVVEDEARKEELDD